MNPRQNNQLTGPVPKLPPLLVWVDLSHNRLSGQMPADRQVETGFLKHGTKQLCEHGTKQLCLGEL